jgi:hypothetical protein
MPQQTPFTPLPGIRTRTPKKIATTTYVNEVAEVVNNLATLPRSGQVIDQQGVSGGSVKGMGEVQGTVLLMRTNNSVGFDDIFFVPPR